MKHKFSNYAHDGDEDSETFEMLVEDYEWDTKDAEKFVRHHRPMYEVKADFEYDTETDKLMVLAAYIEGVKLVPVVESK